MPLKAFVVLVIPLYFLVRVFSPRPLSEYVGNNTTLIDPLAQVLVIIFACCGPVLLAGAIAQLLLRRQKSAVLTMLFGLLPTLIFAFLLFVWAAQHSL